jgi:AmmeMemoRadiSam system protein B
MVRKPIVAGQFYPGNFEELDKEINESFTSKFGPGDLPLKTKEKEILGIIAPHAGYQFSGPGAAWAYKEIAESKLADVYIMLGLSHQGQRSCISLEDWETPFGVVKVDKEFGEQIKKNTGLKEEEEVHAQEHSIEVQLPFLQFARRDYLDKLRILPIIVSDDVDYQKLAKDIVKTIKESGKKVCIIASSDFTHFGLNYGFFPFHKDAKENMYKLDNGAIEHILKLNSYKFLDYVKETGATICGRNPIAVIIDICKELGAKKAKLLHYYTSGDVVGDYGNAVGYAAISIQ